ncbi:MAG: acyloxyacyl hydrolase [Desulfuromusa sp.]|nr:acyloxyacyl hydrolase [Desulfuromusa sp.]
MIWTITVLCILHSSSAYCRKVDQIGFGYGQEFKHNTDISQYEIFYQHPIFYEKNIGSAWKIKSLLEFGAALIDESGSDNSPTGRFSIMPQMLLAPSDWINLIVGLGAGFMAGETELTDQNLGGAFLLSSKVGLQIFLGSRWAVGYTFYHQSNAGIYNHNQGLNINQLAITYQL